MMTTYLTERWSMAIPLEEKLFKEEVVHYMQLHKIENNFPNTLPGTKY